MSKKRKTRNRILSFLCLSSMLVSMIGQSVVSATGAEYENVTVEAVECETEPRADSSGVLDVSGNEVDNEELEVEDYDPPQQNIQDDIIDEDIVVSGGDYEEIPEEVVSVNETVEEVQVNDNAREASVVEYAPSIKVRGVCIDESHSFKFQISPVNDYTDVVHPDSMEIFSPVSDKAEFGKFGFKNAGTYEFLISQVDTSVPNIVQDGRTWKLRVVVEGAGDALTIKSHTYSLFNTTFSNDKSNESCAEFIETTSYVPGYSAATLEKARQVLNGLTLEEKVGQTLICHYTNVTYSNPEDSYKFAQGLVTNYHLGGFVLFKQDFSNNTPQGIKAHIDKIQSSTKIPLIMSVDEEGGKVVRISSLPAYGHSPYPYPQDLVASGGVNAVTADGVDKASFIKSLGLNCDLAPVADTASSGYIYPRTYGGDGVDNAKYVSASVEAMESNGLGTSLKHFPGYGSTSSDTHSGFAVNHLTKEELLYNDLLPFRAGLSVGGKMVMVTHNMYENIDSSNPASLSPAMYSFLRNEIGYNGLAVTDDLYMGAISSFVGSKSACVLAFNAGADMVMTPYPDVEFPKMLAQVKSGGISTDKLNDSVLRILCWKIDHGVLDVELEEEAVYLDSNGNEVHRGTLSSAWNTAVSNGGGTVKLIKNIRSSGTFDTKGQNIVLDLNGCTLDYDLSSGESLFTVSDGGKFAIDNGISGANIVCTKSTGMSLTEGSSTYSGRVLQYYDSSLNAQYSHVNKVDFNVNGLGHINSVSNGSIVKVVNGDFTLKNGILENSKESAISVPEGGVGSVNIKNGAILDSNSIHGGGVCIDSANVPFTMSGGYIVNCSVSGSGGAVYTKGYCNISGESCMARNTGTDGGSVYCSSLDMSGNSLIGYSTAKNWGGAVYVSSKIVLSGNCCVYGNHANRLAGGIYVDSSDNTVSGSPCIRKNTAFNGQQEGLYLKDGKSLKIGSDGLDMYARFVISTESVESMIPVALGGNLDYDKLQCFIPSLDTYNVIYDDGDIYLSNGNGSSISVNVILNGELYNTGTLNTVLETQLEDGRVVSYFNLRSVVGFLSSWGLDWDSYDGEAVFGYQSEKNGTVVVPDIESTKPNNKWRIYVDPSVDVHNVNLIYMPNTLDAGNHDYSDTVETNGFWSVDVQDMYSTFMEMPTNESCSQYVLSGEKVNFDLTYRKAPWNWRVLDKESNRFKSNISHNDDRVNIEISDVHSPVSISNGREGEVLYTVQYYAYVSTLDLTMESGNYALPVIDTSGAKLPENSINQNLKYLKIDDSSNQIRKKSSLVCMYEDTEYLYSMNPRLVQVNRIGNDSGYDLDQLWVLKNGKSPESTDKADFDVYRLSDFEGIDSLCDLHLTNDPKFVSSDTILVSNGSVVRFVYTPTTTLRDKEVEFYDYDISDGYIYQDSSHSTKKPTSSQTNTSRAYANTSKQGINNPNNFSGSGARIGFGNANTGTGMNTEKWQGYPINSRGTAYNGCTFGLVKGIDGDAESGFYPVFSDGIVAPNLFASGDAIGKTKHDGITASFEKIGDTYTLSSINTKTPLNNLQTFNHPTCNGNTYTHIWTNNFWPMDNVDSFGTDGHDLKFGDYGTRSNRVFGTGSVFPVADDGTDHNSYFGMSFNVNFSIPKGYKGPMEYCFFGDDDMWVFLDNKKIIDIGGVHSSVGEYANLWDYIDDTGEESNHTLTVFYTERGASGSTCWMEFTLPKVKFGSTDKNVSEGSVEVYKEVTGKEVDSKEEFEFTMSILDELGENPNDDYSYYKVSTTGEIIEYGLIQRGMGRFKLVSGEHIVVPYIPKGYKYKIDEDKYGCTTSISTNSTEGISSTSYMGVVEENKTHSIYYTNNFGIEMPSTGSADFYKLVASGILLVLLGVVGYCNLIKKQRRYYIK